MSSIGRVRNVVVGRGRTVRLGPWRGQDGVASVATYVDEPIDEHAVSDIVRRLHRSGYRRAITAALAPHEQTAFLANGFVCLRDLVLLRRSLRHPVARAEHSLRRWRRRRYDELLTVDAAAFEPFWRLDELALRESLDATPHRFLRVTSEHPPVGYALSGVARDRGYLQRLAVHPSAAGRGIGTALVLDALRWMRWRGADDAFVNTQGDNERALTLYDRLGFAPESEGLAILGLELDDRRPGTDRGEPGIGSWIQETGED